MGSFQLEGRTRVAAIAVAGLIGVLVVALSGLWFVQRDRVLPNTTVAGVEVGGMSAEEASAALSATADAREQDPVRFVAEDLEVEVAPGELDYRIDLDATVATAMRRGRAGLPGDAVVRVRSLWRTAAYDLVEDHDPDRIEAWAGELAEQLDRPRSPGVVEVDPDTLEVTTELPHGSRTVRREETAEVLLTALRTPGPEELDLPADTSPPLVPDEDVEQLATQVRRAIEAPLVLRGGDDAAITLEPTEVAQLFEIVERSISAEAATLELVVTPDRVEQVVGEAAEEFVTPPQDASYSSSRTPPVTFDAQGSTTFEPVEVDVEVVPGVDGTRFDPERSAEQLTGLLRDGGRSVELRLEPVEPEFSTERATELGPTHLLGTFTTYYTAGQSRSRNIQLLADIIDNTVLLPGEEFSINDISGPRTCSAGFLPAGTIVAGELVDTCGGGTSQFGTTAFNAGFFSGMQLDDWKAHSWYISRYPMGREATLTYPQLDVRFTNVTNGIAIVRASHTASSVTVTVYGQPIASAVSARHGSPFNRTSFPTRTRTVSDLFEDQERVVQSGAGGFTVEVVRVIDLLDGGTEEETIRTVYVPQARIIEQGSRARPEPEPEPEPDPTPDPEPSPDPPPPPPDPEPEPEPDPPADSGNGNGD